MIVSLIAGVLLGILYYGGLWITVRRLVNTRHLIVLTLGSLVLRVALALAGFLAVAGGRWQNALAYLIGFTIGRVVVSRFWVACI